MNNGLQGFPARAVRRFEGEPQTIDTSNGNYFHHGLGVPPAGVEIRLVCVAANNGYVVGEQVPLVMVHRNAAGNMDGAPRYSVRITDQHVLVFIAASTIAIITSAAVTAGTFTPAEWKLKVWCSDHYPIA